ncbi:MAG: protein kinase [Deltaproteobacteria bacterium]|nr:protein kinase [Deltaproteobacteria bacterium]
MTDLIGKVFERKYRLVRLLGEGGMGAVYEAEHTLLNRTVAVKVMHRNIASNPRAVDRFFREAQAASAIGHPNIIEIFDVGKDEDDEVFMVMELLRGESLDSVLDKRGHLPPGRTIAIILQVLSALHAAHNKGIIHRDLKADNVFLAVDSRMREDVKLLDFGIAKVISTDSDEDLGLTKTGTVLGTPHYLSPEQARGGKDIDHRIDIWTVGVLMYEMLTGRLPFEGENYNEILSKVLLDEPTPIGEHMPGTPQVLVQFVEKALSKNRDDRFATVAEMIEDLMPLHDQASDELSTSVFATLKSSVVPPPYVPENGEEEQPALVGLPDTVPNKPIQKTLPETAELRTPESPIDTLSPDLLNTIDTTVNTPLDDGLPKSKLPIFAAIGLAAAAVAVLLIFGLGGNGKPSVVAGDVSTEEIPKELVEPAVTPDLKPEPAAKSIEVTTEGAPVKPTAAKTVTLKFKGLPVGAVVTMDEKKVTPPVTFPKSEEPISVKVSAPGYKPFEKNVVPRQSQIVWVSMKKAAAAKSTKKAGSSGRIQNPYATTSKKTSSSKSAKKKKVKKKKDKVWADNPFGN